MYPQAVRNAVSVAWLNLKVMPTIPNMGYIVCSMVLKSFLNALKKPYGVVEIISFTFLPMLYVT